LLPASTESPRTGSGRVKGLTLILHYLHGVPVRKAPAIITDLTGVRLTQSAITELWKWHSEVKHSAHARR
jgi:hypothetical protein